MKNILKYKYYLILFIVALSVYAQTATYKFIFDDKNLIERNHLIKNSKFIPEIFSKEFFNEPGTKTGYYRPLVNFSFLLEYKLWKLNPSGFHITNILLHAINTIFTMLLLLYLTKRKKLAFVLALIFAVLPVHTSAVAYIAGRTDLLNTLFALSSLLLFFKYQNTKKYIPLILSLLCFLLSLLAKETSILLPVFIAFYLYSKNEIKNLSSIKIASLFFITAGCFMVVRGFVTSMPPGSLLGNNLFLRLFTINRILFDYIMLVIFPNNLHFEKMTQIMPLTNVKTIVALIINPLLLLGFFKAAKQNKQYYLSGLFFILFILPTIHLIPIYVQGRLFTAEHFLYMPVIGLLAILGLLVLDITTKYKKTITPLKIILPLWGLFLIIKTVSANYSYSDNGVFYADNLKHTPYSIRLLNNYGNYLSDRNKINEARMQYDTALKEDPNHANTLYNIGTLFIKTGEFAKATDAINKAIEKNPHRDVFYNNLSVAYSKQQKYKEAFTAQKKALTLNPSESDYTYNLGVFSMALNNYKQARIFFTQAANNNPQASYFSAIASVDFVEKKYKDALMNNLKALEFTPNQQETLYNTAICYLTLNNKPAGLEYLKKVIEVNPNNVFAQKASYEINKISKPTRRLKPRHKISKS